MGELIVRLVTGVREWVLDDDPRIVPAGQVILAVAGSGAKTVSLDGKRMRLSGGLLSVDLTRSTGYHRLDVDGRTFWFGTQDAKLRLAGIESMLNELGSLGTGWGGQVLFSDGQGLRDAHVVYGWLDEWAEFALTAIAEVLASPRPRSTRSTALSRRGGAGVLRAPTLRLLRSAPRQYLSPNPEGALTMSDGSRYDPLRVVVQKRSSTLDTIANRRAVSLLPWLIRLTREVLDSGPSEGAKTRCRLWLNQAETLARRPLAQALRTNRQGPGQPRQAEESTEAAYRKTYSLASDIRRLFGWSASTQPLPRYSYVDRSDQIYQAYSASRLARELGLRQTHPILGMEPLAFTGEDFDLYYDVVPPGSVLRSWRASSERPDDSRPDLVLHERASGRVAILDAKYRVARDGGASEDSRKEVTSYLGLYGVPAISILFPGGGSPTTVNGHGLSIHEIPLRPGSELQEAIPLIIDSLSHPPY
ncbi:MULTISPECIES: hypothetical protein [Rhodococcus]|uniref:McrBC 5-methylcytosine restriction system component n=1 Tax=Rhodococcus opacus RKJ300 = JCM 13270 TaxID=1165867 RepID=I0WM02_RHOOP|nr:MULTISPECIES: hypothetical protein [Rhodococcus]EID77418.1 hypothetical protein W59_23750 [Rhodococcus opacus RKJ300 = JCM 13270]QQZ18427.1 hypothetical protein GO592_40290 [Rhodococcus sp. 21391]